MKDRPELSDENVFGLNSQNKEADLGIVGDNSYWSIK